jgi:hypothetical protein
MKISKYNFILFIILIFTQANLLYAQDTESAPKKTPKMTDAYSSGSTRKSASTESVNWLRYTPGNRALSLELPGELRRVEMQMPDSLKNLVRDMEGYTYDSDQLEVRVLYYSLANITPTPTHLQALAKGYMQAATRYPDIKNVKFDTGMESASRLIITGSYEQNGITTMVNGLVRARGTEVWMMITAYPDYAETSPAASERILKSTKIQ